MPMEGEMKTKGKYESDGKHKHSLVPNHYAINTQRSTPS